MIHNDEAALNEQGKESSGQQVGKLSPQDSNAVDVLHLQKAASLDIIEEGCGKATRSRGRPCIYSYDKNDEGYKTMADLLGSSLHTKEDE